MRKKIFNRVKHFESLIFIPSNTPWRYTVDYVDQTVDELEKMNNLLVCYLYGDGVSWRNIFKKSEFPPFVKKGGDSVYFYNPFHFIPFRRYPYVGKVNHLINMLIVRVLINYLSFINSIKKKIFWVFDPNLHYLLKPLGNDYYLLYDCVDLYASADVNSIRETYKNEKLLCQKANLVVGNSMVLLRHLKEYRSDVKLVPQGFRIDGFEVDKEKFVNLRLSSPVIGFIGGINNRLDTKLLYLLIKDNPSWNFVIWGPVQKDIRTGSERSDEIAGILKFPNVTTGKSEDKREVPGLISQFDVGIIPYDIGQDFNKYCYPMKLFEYFYLGKPVVSTDIIELRRFPGIVEIGKDAGEWKRIIEKLIRRGWSSQKKKKEKMFAVENSWFEKVSQICGYIK